MKDFSPDYRSSMSKRATFKTALKKIILYILCLVFISQNIFAQSQGQKIDQNQTDVAGEKADNPAIQIREQIFVEKKESETPFRRGEVVFFISYPFMFLANFLALGSFGYLIRYAESGKSDFQPKGIFFALVATTTAFCSLGVALNDHYAVKAAGGFDPVQGSNGRLMFEYRF